MKGEYIPNLHTNKSCLYDYFVLVRIKPDGEKLMSANRLLYADSIGREQLYTLITSAQWEYDIVGYITHKDLTYLIEQNFILPKQALLNGKIPMDAENYYIQSGDMKNFSELIKKLSLLN